MQERNLAGGGGMDKKGDRGREEKRGREGKKMRFREMWVSTSYRVLHRRRWQRVDLSELNESKMCCFP